jgi:hypothetical protein
VEADGGVHASDQAERIPFQCMRRAYDHKKKIRSLGRMRMPSDVSMEVKEEIYNNNVKSYLTPLCTVCLCSVKRRLPSVWRPADCEALVSRLVHLEPHFGQSNHMMMSCFAGVQTIEPRKVLTTKDDRDFKSIYSLGKKVRSLVRLVKNSCRCRSRPS